MSLPITDRSNFWRTHLESAKDFNGSAREYCEREGISIQSFYHWRGRLKQDRALKRFAAVEVSEIPRIAQNRPAGQLPDPEWVAKFVVQLFLEVTT